MCTPSENSENIENGLGLWLRWGGVYHGENGVNCENGKIALCLWPGCVVCTTPNENFENCENG